MPWLHSACGHCEFCITAGKTLCTAQQNTGYSVNGTFAEYVLSIPTTWSLPANVAFDASHLFSVPASPSTRA